MSETNTPLIGILMGSASDAPAMRKACEVLDELQIPYEWKVCSAHRTPQRAHDYGSTAAGRGIKIIIAAAGMSAHLAGVMASLTHIPVLGVPMAGGISGGLDALLSTCNMPKGIPVGTMSVGSHGAVNSALFAAAILALSDKQIEARLLAFRKKQTEAVPDVPPDS